MCVPLLHFSNDAVILPCSIDATASAITADALRTEVETLIGQNTASLSDEIDEAIDTAVGELYVSL